MGLGLLRFERPLTCLPSVFRRLYAGFGASFVYTRFSQTSTREKKLASDLITEAGRKKGESMAGQYCGRARRCHVTLLKANLERLAERRRSARIGHP